MTSGYAQQKMSLFLPLLDLLTLPDLENISVFHLQGSKTFALAVLWSMLHVAAAGRMCPFVFETKIYGGLDTARD